jgi:hypothetical protein
VPSGQSPREFLDDSFKSWPVHDRSARLRWCSEVTAAAGLPVRFVSADEPTLRGPEWIEQQWDAARLLAGRTGAILVIDEVQKAAGWPESIKRFWDEDTRTKVPIRVVLLGSAPLLIQRGLSESLAAGSRSSTCRTGRWRR